MEFKEPRSKPEKEGADRLIKFMKSRGWYMFPRLHGSMFQKGYPDSLWGHKAFGQRFIEFKIRTGGLEPSQVEIFTKMAAYGIGVWVLYDERYYNKLFEPPNWWQYCMRGRIR